MSFISGFKGGKVRYTGTSIIQLQDLIRGRSDLGIYPNGIIQPGAFIPAGINFSSIIDQVEIVCEDPWNETGGAANIPLNDKYKKIYKFGSYSSMINPPNQFSSNRRYWLISTDNSGRFTEPYKTMGPYTIPEIADSMGQLLFKNNLLLCSPDPYGTIRIPKENENDANVYVYAYDDSPLFIDRQSWFTYTYNGSGGVVDSDHHQSLGFGSVYLDISDYPDVSIRNKQFIIQPIIPNSYGKLFKIRMTNMEYLFDEYNAKQLRNEFDIGSIDSTTVLKDEDGNEKTVQQWIDIDNLPSSVISSEYFNNTIYSFWKLLDFASGASRPSNLPIIYSILEYTGPQERFSNGSLKYKYYDYELISSLGKYKLFITGRQSVQILSAEHFYNVFNSVSNIKDHFFMSETNSLLSSDFKSKDDTWKYQNDMIRIYNDGQSRTGPRNINSLVQHALSGGNISQIKKSLLSTDYYETINSTQPMFPTYPLNNTTYPQFNQISNGSTGILDNVSSAHDNTLKDGAYPSWQTFFIITYNSGFSNIESSSGPYDSNMISELSPGLYDRYVPNPQSVSSDPYAKLEDTIYYLNGVVELGPIKNSDLIRLIKNSLITSSSMIKLKPEDDYDLATNIPEINAIFSSPIVSYYYLPYSVLSDFKFLDLSVDMSTNKLIMGSNGLHFGLILLTAMQTYHPNKWNHWFTVDAFYEGDINDQKSFEFSRNQNDSILLCGPKGCSRILKVNNPLIDFECFEFIMTNPTSQDIDTSNLDFRDVVSFKNTYLNTGSGTLLEFAGVYDYLFGFKEWLKVINPLMNPEGPYLNQNPYISSYTIGVYELELVFSPHPNITRILNILKTSANLHPDIIEFLPATIKEPTISDTLDNISVVISGIQTFPPVRWEYNWDYPIEFGFPFHFNPISPYFFIDPSDNSSNLITNVPIISRQYLDMDVSTIYKNAVSKKPSLIFEVPIAWLSVPLAVKNSDPEIAIACIRSDKGGIASYYAFNESVRYLGNLPSELIKYLGMVTPLYESLRAEYGVSVPISGMSHGDHSGYLSIPALNFLHTSDLFRIASKFMNESVSRLNNSNIYEIMWSNQLDRGILKLKPKHSNKFN